MPEFLRWWPLSLHCTTIGCQTLPKADRYNKGAANNVFDAKNRFQNVCYIFPKKCAKFVSEDKISGL